MQHNKDTTRELNSTSTPQQSFQKTASSHTHTDFDSTNQASTHYGSAAANCSTVHLKNSSALESSEAESSEANLATAHSTLHEKCIWLLWDRNGWSKHHTLFSIEDARSTGPDSFSSKFYKLHWNSLSNILAFLLHLAIYMPRIIRPCYIKIVLD